MTATLIILPLLAAGLLALAVYEWHVSRQIVRLAQRVHDAMDGCQTVWVRITWRTRDVPWELHTADLTLDCLPDLLADHPDLCDAIEHDTAWISFPTHPDRREGGHHGDKANKHDRG